MSRFFPTPAECGHHTIFGNVIRGYDVVEKIARTSRLSESDVANTAIQLARDCVTGNGGSQRAAHVGFSRKSISLR